MISRHFYIKLFKLSVLLRSATGQSFLGDSLDFQAALHDLAGGLFVLIECVRVNIQRGRRLAVSEKPCDRADIRAAGDEQACRRVAQAVDVQIGWKIVCFQDFLEAPCEGRWSKEAQKEKEKCESGQDLTEEICAVAEAVIPT